MFVHPNVMPPIIYTLQKVHYAGTPSKGSKISGGLSWEAKLLQRGSPMQQTMEKQSRAIFDIEAAPSELDCSQQVLVPESDQFHEGHGGSESLRRHASDVYLSSSTLPLGLQAGEPLPKISSSQTMQGHSYVKNDGEKHAGFMKAVSTDFEGHMLSNDLSTMDTTFLKDPCISEEVRFENKGLNLFSNFEDVRRVRYMGKQSGRIELSNDLHTLKDGLSDGLNEVEGSMVEFSNDNCSMSDASKSHDEDYEFNENSNPKVIACSSACFEKGNIPIGEQNSQLIVPKDDMLLSMQNMKENDQECESKSSANVFLDEYQTLPLWVKWRGKWQTGLRCPLVDCPLSTLKAKPTHERKKYISIFFPRTRTYSWVDMLLVCSINEFPHPLACGTHRRWRKLVKDLSAPRRYILQKLAIALLNIGDELHTEAIIEVARVATTWKDFAMECSHCRDYPSLGKMLLKLQSMILPKCVHKDWLENSLDSWMQRCRSAQSAESIESLTEELVESIMWTKVNELWTAPMKPELDPEWKTWKQEAMKLFFASYQEAVDKNVEQNNSDVSVKSGAQTSRKRLKLEIRRPETSARIIGNLECQVLSHNKCPNADPGFGISDGVSNCH
ncbi:hypothetical protein HPP92_007810 [Vanilla planifolia]|uniref:Uncharacterized protein n=1 Tax=Vanilla planifolia TaxID=51239 RepID=A0A835RHC5_VANPL|nr:hypothetical protein HPP92_007810 [Vanilla planifolia]